ncbi:MAG: hypothetical protein ABJG15_01130 [Hyphomonadaceae bacterium]
MSGSLIALIVVSGFVLWGGYLYYQRSQIRAEAVETFCSYKKDGTLDAHVGEASYVATYIRAEGPRFGIYLYVTALVAVFGILILLRLFNFIWNFVWLRTGKLGWFDVGELPHSLATVFLYVGIMFLATWVSMQHYHKTAPGKLRNEIRRLNENGTDE